MKRRLLAVLLSAAALAASACTSGNTAQPAETQAEKGTIKSLSQLDGCTIGVQSGTSMGDTVKEVVPGATVSQYRNYTFLTDALKKGDIDAFPADDPVIRELCNKDTSLTYINEIVDPGDFAFCFPKSEKGGQLKDQFNEYVAELKTSGELDKINEKWMGADDSVKVVEDYSSLPATNGTLKFATEGDYAPFDYFKDNQLAGMDIELAVGFCKKYGYGLEIYTMTFGDIIPAVEAESYDFGGAAITVNDERQKQVDFSEPTYTGGILFCVLK